MLYFGNFEANYMNISIELPEISTIIDTLISYFDKNRIEQEAKDANFIQKPRKLTGMGFFCICIMQGFGCSLSLMCGTLKGFSISVCEQSLNERFTDSAVVFMKRLFEQMLQLELSKSVQMDFLSKFSGVFIQDSTVIKLPDSMASMFKGSGGSAGKSSVKVDFQMDVQGSASHIDIRGGTSGDNAQAVQNVKTGALYIRDLGYFNIPFFRLIMESGGYFLSRLRSKSVIYGDIEGKTVIDIFEITQKMKADDTLHIPVFIGYRKFVPVFLIVQKLPPEAIAVKIERAKKDHQKRMTPMTKEHIAWCEFNSYITNIPFSWFDALTLIQIYGIRWQIEIMFKVWKSIFKLRDVGKIGEKRVLCMLYGRLTWILMQMKIFRVFKKDIYGVSQKEVSEIRGFKQLNELKSEFRVAIKSGMAEIWRQLILFLFGLIQDFALKKKRKKKMPPLYNSNFQCLTD
jgi:hypothetical protein